MYTCNHMVFVLWSNYFYIKKPTQLLYLLAKGNALKGTDYSTCNIAVNSFSEIVFFNNTQL